MKKFEAMFQRNLYRLACLLFTFYSFLVDSTRTVSEKSSNAARSSSGIAHVSISKPLDINERDDTYYDIGDSNLNRRDVHTQADAQEHVQNVAEMNSWSLRDSPDRFRRSADNDVDGNGWMKREDSENVTISRENGSFSSPEQNVSKVVASKEPNRTRKTRPRLGHLYPQALRNDNSDRPFAPTDWDNVATDTEAQQTTSYPYTTTASSVTSSLDELLLREFNKRKNRPSWLRQRQETTSNDPVVTPDSMTIHVNVSGSNSSTLNGSDAESGAPYVTDMMVVFAESGHNVSGVTDSIVEKSETYLSELQDSKEANESQPQTSSSSSTTEIISESTTIAPTPAKDNRKQQEKSHVTLTHNRGNKTDDVSVTDKTVFRQNYPKSNHTTQYLFETLLRLSELESDDTVVGNCSTLECLNTTNLEKDDVETTAEEKYNNNETLECPTCAQTEIGVKQLRLSMFKNLLVKKLRLDPKLLYREGSTDDRMENRIPKLPMSIVEQTMKDNVREFEKDEFHAKDQELIIAGEDMGRDCVKLHVTGCFTFNFKGKVKDEVAEAQLWLYKMVDPADINGQTINLYELERLRSGRLAHSSMLASVDTVVGEGWVVMNITRSVRKWVHKRKGFEMLAIRCATCTTRSHKALYGAKLDYKPLLIIKYSENSYNSRSKRSVPCDPVIECCKRDLEVNFHDIGMADIIQPRQLAVGYCYGNCNEIDQYTYNHTAIKQRHRWSDALADQHSLRQQLKPCCAPLILKDIYIMTSDGDGTMVRKRLPKVIVETCGCM